MARGRDVRIARLAAKILRDSRKGFWGKRKGAGPREYKKQAAAILKWVQDPDNIYFLNEAGERLQDPIYTLKAGHADCDDMVSVLAALYESINLPWRLVISGRQDPNGKKVRWIEGVGPVPQYTRWTHIYLLVGGSPGKPKKWYFAEPTVVGVPLGWDVVDGDDSYLPEMAKKKATGPARIVRLKKAPLGFRPGPLPPKRYRSPAYAEAAYGDAGGFVPSGRFNPSSALSSSRSGVMVGGAVGASVAQREEDSKGEVNWSGIAEGIFTGVVISVGTSILLDWINGAGIWEGRGHVGKRWAKVTAAGVTATAAIPAE